MIVFVVIRVRQGAQEERPKEPETPERACYDERFVWIYINTKVRDRYT